MYILCKALINTYNNLMIHCLGIQDIQEVCLPLRKTEMTKKHLILHKILMQ